MDSGLNCFGLCYRAYKIKRSLAACGYERIGLVDLLREHKWGLTVAGSMVRYRRRIRPFARFVGCVIPDDLG